MDQKKYSGLYAQISEQLLSLGVSMFTTGHEIKMTNFRKLRASTAQLATFIESGD
jgi:hypothetical protein